MKIIGLLIPIFLLTQISCAQKKAVPVISKQFGFVDSVLSKTNYALEEMDFVFPKNIQVIMQHFQSALAENREWADEYLSKNMKPGEPLPYHPNFGVTKEEYQQVLDLKNHPLVVEVKNRSVLIVARNESKLSFTETGKEAGVFSFLKIDLQHELVVFNNDTIPFAKEITLPATSPFGTGKGFSWRKEMTDPSQVEAPKISTLTSKFIEVSFIKIDANGKLLLLLKYKEADNGELKANIDMACYLSAK